MTTAGLTFTEDADDDPELEARRLATLRAYRIFGTPPEARFDDSTKFLAETFDVPIALISFVDADQVAFKSMIGLSQAFLPRRETFCQFVVQRNEALIVEDAAADPRFRALALVAGAAAIRYYAAVPLISSEGYRIGTVAFADRRPRPDLGAQPADMLARFGKALMHDTTFRLHVANLVFHQELNAEIAGASDFQTALDTVLVRAGERLGALYCLVAEQHEDPARFNLIAGVAIAPEFLVPVAEAIAPPDLELSAFVSAPALTEQRAVDTGVLTEESLRKFMPAGKRFFALGTRRQIAVPLILGERRAALLLGFARHHISKSEVRFLSDLVAKLVPLLRGRLREEEIKRRRVQMDYINRAMRTLVGANQALARAGTELELMQTICEVAVTQGGYVAAWVGFAEDDANRGIRVVAKWGDHLERLASYPLTWSDAPAGRRPAGTAIREDRLVARFFRPLGMWDDPDPAAARAFGSVIAVPLRRPDSRPFGVFTLYSATRVSAVPSGRLILDGQEEELLTELARDIVNGIDMIRARNARNEAIEKQRESDAKLANLLAASPTALFAMEYDGKRWRNVETTQNFERMTGHTAADHAGETSWWRQHIHKDDYGLAAAAMRRIRQTRRATTQFRLQHPSGGYRWMRAELELHPASADRPARIVGAWSDITQQKEAQNEIQRLAFYDQLTGLPNRQHLLDHIRQTVAQARQQPFQSALLFIDLDRFKSINDAHGHATGDQVLIAVADKLLKCMRGSDMVARLGGDEFVVLLPRLGTAAGSGAAQALAVAEKLAAAVDRQMQFDTLSLRVTASIGIYLFSGQDDGLEEILRSADTAMYAAKSITKNQAWNGGHSNISVFETAMRERLDRYHEAQDGIRTALAERRLELWLQPQVDAKAKVIGAEALIRLRRPDGSLLQPAEFIAIAEETGLIVPIGEWVRAEACRLLACYPPARLPRLSVNVSAIEFHQPQIADELLALLRKTRIDPRRLTLEITENLLIDRLDETIAKLERLVAAGVNISIDDFGTGYSSLGYLQRLPIQEIKIDKRFVGGMLTDPRSAELVQTLIMLAGNFKFGIVAEGVETPAQAAFLRGHDCRFMQGFLFGKPRPATEFNRNRRAAGRAREA